MGDLVHGQVHEPEQEARHPGRGEPAHASVVDVLRGGFGDEDTGGVVFEVVVGGGEDAAILCRETWLWVLIIRCVT